MLGAVLIGYVADIDTSTDDIGARIAVLAAASEVLVSQTVEHLMIGSNLAFEDRGLHSSKASPANRASMPLGEDERTQSPKSASPTRMRVAPSSTATR